MVQQEEEQEVEEAAEEELNRDRQTFEIIDSRILHATLRFCWWHNQRPFRLEGLPHEPEGIG
jgi:hypothetical protein